MVAVSPLVLSFLVWWLPAAVNCEGVALHTPSLGLLRLDLRLLSRCHGVRSSHCSDYYLQPLVDLKPAPVHSKPCPNNCSKLGVCHGDTGLCDCPAGVGGPDCSAADLRPCTNRYRDRSSRVPASHIGANKRDLNWSAPGWTSSRCAGVCDDATGICYCDGPHFGRVPAPEGSPPGTPPIRPGRLLHGNCQRLTTDDKGGRLHWGSKPGMTYEDIYGAQGWCTVDKPFLRCSCDMDGVDGKLCELQTETVCPNQCSGHGTCSRGFCACFPGWFGLDCARLSDPSSLLPPPDAASGAAAGQLLAQVAADAAPAASAANAGGGAAESAGGGDDDNDAEPAQVAGRPALQPRLPAHLALAAERPHLAAHYVDTWAATAAAAAAAATGSQAAAGDATAANAAASGPNPAAAAAAAAAGGGPLAGSASGGGGRLPPVYLTPLSADEAESGAAAAAAAAAGDAGSLSREAIEAEHNGQRRVLAADATTNAPGRHRLQAAGEARHAAAPAAAAGGAPGAGAAADEDGDDDPWAGDDGDDDAEGSAQQQRRRRARHRRQRRSLLRHFWTGGGSQRAAMSIAPSQSAVDAAVAAFLQSGRSAPAGGGNNGSSSADSSVDALAAALVGAGVRTDRLARASDAAVLQRMVEAGLGRPLPPGKARRPRIFVYDMPSRFVGRLLQYRASKRLCTWRVFSKGNYSMYTTADGGGGWRYPLESHLHELMLMSPHRTLDPTEADYFYVPVYAACFMEAVAGWADTPWWHSHSELLVGQGVSMYLDALAWLRTTHPHWNASGGADHIWLFAHDEGACWAPGEIYNASIILSPWGRLAPPTHQSRHGPVTESITSRWEFNYNKPEAAPDPAGPPGGYGAAITGHPCYTPGKDLVLPAFRPPPAFHASPFMGGDASRGRDILLLLRGDLGAGRPPGFSRGLRQRLAKLARDGAWRARHRIWVGTPAELEGDGSALLARARFCLVVPGDGWSGQLEDALLHGCIPVVVALPGEAGAAQPFSGLLRLSSAVLKVSPEQLGGLPEILAGVSEPEEAELRRQGGRWWARMAWLSHPWLRGQAATLVAENLGRHPRVKDGLEEQAVAQAAAKQAMGARPAQPAEAAAADAPVDADDVAAAEKTAALFDVSVWQPDAPLDDAFTTLMQWLHYKMRRPYKASERAKTGAGSSGQQKKHTRHGESLPPPGTAITTERRQRL